MDDVRATIAGLIRDATRTRQALLGGILEPYGDDYALILPGGEDYLISVKPARVVVTDAALAGTGEDRGQGDG